MVEQGITKKWSIARIHFWLLTVSLWFSQLRDWFFSPRTEMKEKDRRPENEAIAEYTPATLFSK